MGQAKFQEDKMKGLLLTVGIMGVCLAMPTNVEVMPSTSGGTGLPPVQSGMPEGSNIEALPSNAGSMTKPNWPGSYPSSGYGGAYPAGGSGYTFQPARTYGGSYGGGYAGSGCSSGGCSSGGYSSYPGLNTYPAPLPSYGRSGWGSSGYYPGTGGSSGYNPGTGGSSGYNPGITSGGFSTLPASISGSGASAGFSTLPGSISSSGVSGRYRPVYGGGCG